MILGELWAMNEPSQPSGTTAKKSHPERFGGQNNSQYTHIHTHTHTHTYTHIHTHIHAHVTMHWIIYFSSYQKYLSRLMQQVLSIIITSCFLPPILPLRRIDQ